jgi:hypothetical protein
LTECAIAHAEHHERVLDFMAGTAVGNLDRAGRRR